MADNPLWSLYQSVREGLSANKALSAYREAGGSIRNETFRSLYASARQVLQQEVDEATRPLDRPPTPDELTPLPTRQATGVLQRIQLFVRDKGTNAVRTIFTDVKSDTGLDRRDAIAQAMDDYGDAAEEYDQDVLGGVHVGSYGLTPMGPNW